MNQKRSIGFIGTGNMGAAILKGIAGSAMAAECSLYAYNRTREKAEALAAYGVTVLDSAAAVAEACDYVFLAVKPQQFGEVLPQIRAAVTKDTVLISIAAGITGDYIRRETIPEAKVVLAMPNTPLLLGLGATALAYEAPTTAEEFAVVREIFNSCGITEEVPADKMKEVIAINGSSPAFIYLYAKGFIDYAAQVGISADAAMQLFAQTLVGSAKMLTDSGMDVDALIRQVSSPGGTTLAGLEQLYAGKLTETVAAACAHCTRRAYELSK